MSKKKHKSLSEMSREEYEATVRKDLNWSDWGFWEHRPPPRPPIRVESACFPGVRYTNSDLREFFN